MWYRLGESRVTVKRGVGVGVEAGAGARIGIYLFFLKKAVLGLESGLVSLTPTLTLTLTLTLILQQHSFFKKDRPRPRPRVLLTPVRVGTQAGTSQLLQTMQFQETFSRPK